jgi:hypothetical protein
MRAATKTPASSDADEVPQTPYGRIVYAQDVRTGAYGIAEIARPGAVLRGEHPGGNSRDGGAAL